MRKIFILCFCYLLFGTTAFSQYAFVGDIKVTEIMYNPPGKGTDRFQYIEFYNTTGSTIKLGGYMIKGVKKYPIPNNISVAAKSYILFCADSLALDSVSGHTVHGWQWWNGHSLSHGADTVGILDPTGVAIDTIGYQSKAPYPSASDGNGPSMALCTVTDNEHHGANWSLGTEYIGTVAGKAMRGSPGTGCAITGSKDTIPPAVVNVHASNKNKLKVVFSKSVGPSADSISHYSGIKGISAGTRVPTNDTVVITLTNSIKKGQYYYMTVSGIRDSSGNVMPKPTTYRFIYNNTQTGLVISEVMYNNPGNDNYEFLEIYNKSTDTIPLGGLVMTQGITFTFPEKINLNPGKYFVLAVDSAHFDSFYHSPVRPLQWDAGQALSNSGELLQFENTQGDIIDSFTYGIKSPWPTLANGQGSSMVLCNGMLDNSVASNWSASADFVDTLKGGVFVYASPGKKCSSSSVPYAVSWSSHSFCKNDTLNAGNTGSIFRWSNDSTQQSIVATTPGKYWVVVVNGAGSVTDSVNLSPFKAAAVIPDSVCESSSAKLFDISDEPSNVKRVWNLGDSTTTSTQNPIHKYTSQGTKTVTLKISDAYCSDSLSKTLTVMVCTAIEDQAQVIPISNIFPNPSNGVFDVIFSEINEQMNLKVMDATGRIVHTQTVQANSSGQEHIDLHTLGKGVYFLNITGQKASQTMKLVIY